MNVISRKEAKENGLLYYFTGNPCKHGHVEKRRLVNSECVACAVTYRQTTKYKTAQARHEANRRARMKDNPDYNRMVKTASKKHRDKYQEYYKQLNHQYYIDNKERLLTLGKAWALLNKDLVSEYNSQYYIDNKIKYKYTHANYLANKTAILKRSKKYKLQHKDRTRTLDFLWRKNNSGALTATSNRRRAKKLRATPKWLTSNDNILIKQKYNESQQLTKNTGIKYVVDHYYPLQGETVSGLHCPTNLMIISSNENSRKGNKHPDIFYGEQN